LEVFDDIRHIGLTAIDTGVGQCTIQKLSRRTDERFSLKVFVVARLFSNKEKCCALLPRAKNRLSGALPEVTGFAVCCRSAKGAKRMRFGVDELVHEVFSRWNCAHGFPFRKRRP